MKQAHVVTPLTAEKEKETPWLPSPAVHTCVGGRGRDQEERGQCLWSHAEPWFWGIESVLYLQDLKKPKGASAF